MMMIYYSDDINDKYDNDDYSYDDGDVDHDNCIIVTHMIMIVTIINHFDDDD